MPAGKVWAATANPGAWHGSVTNHRHAVFLKLFVTRHHRQIVQFGGGDNKTVAGVVMNLMSAIEVVVKVGKRE